MTVSAKTNMFTTVDGFQVDWCAKMQHVPNPCSMAAGLILLFGWYYLPADAVLPSLFFTFVSFFVVVFEVQNQLLFGDILNLHLFFSTHLTYYVQLLPNLVLTFLHVFSFTDAWSLITTFKKHFVLVQNKIFQKKKKEILTRPKIWMNLSFFDKCELKNICNVRLTVFKSMYC